MLLKKIDALPTDHLMPTCMLMQEIKDGIMGRTATQCPSLPYQQGTDTPLDSDWTCISLDDNICVTSRLGVTVLSTLITLKFIHLKFQQKYK